MIRKSIYVNIRRALNVTSTNTDGQIRRLLGLMAEMGLVGNLAQ